MLRRLLLTVACALISLPALAEPIDPAAEKVMDRFVGGWQSEIIRKDPEAPGGRRLGSQEVVRRELKGRYLVGREASTTSNVKFMWFMTYDPKAKNYAWTYFNTEGLLGTEWRGTWDEASSTLTSKSSGAPATWSSDSVYRFATEDQIESTAWMKNDKGESIFDVWAKKLRERQEVEDKIMGRWSEAPHPGAFSPEFGVLHKLAGSWDVTVVSKKAEWEPEEKRRKCKVERRWVLNYKYLQDVSKYDDGAESISLLTYDTKRKEYRDWCFNSDGSTVKNRGLWNVATNKLELESKLPEGQTLKSSVHFTDHEHHEWKVLITDAAGKVYFDCTWNCVAPKH